MTVPRWPNNGVTRQECLLIVSAEVDINNGKEWSGGGATTKRKVRVWKPIDTNQEHSN
jgi:hypothetical protein